jgi:hypothetical protein
MGKRRTTMVEDSALNALEGFFYASLFDMEEDE